MPYSSIAKHDLTLSLGIAYCLFSLAETHPYFDGHLNLLLAEFEQVFVKSNLTLGECNNDRGTPKLEESNLVTLSDSCSRRLPLAMYSECWLGSEYGHGHLRTY